MVESNDKISGFIRKNFSALPIGNVTLDDVFEIIKLWEMEKAAEMAGTLTKQSPGIPDLSDPKNSTILIRGPQDGKPGEMYILGKKIEDGDLVAKIFLRCYSDPFLNIDTDILNFMTSPESNHKDDVGLLYSWERYRLKIVSEEIINKNT
jgi:hypothetical protein